MGNNNQNDQDEKQHPFNHETQDSSVDLDKPVSAAGKSIRERVLEAMSQRAEDGAISDERPDPQPVQNSQVTPKPEQPDKGELPIEKLESEPVEQAVIENNMTPREGYEESEISPAKLESRRRRTMRQKENSMVKKIVLIVVVALIIMIVALGFTFYRYWQAGLKPLNPKNKDLVQVEIPINTSNKGVGAILEKEKVIKSGLVFTYYVKTNNITDFKAGYYQMSPDMSLDEIGELLQQGGTDEPVALADARLTIPEGYSIDQISKLFAEKTDSGKEDFLAVIKDEAFFKQLVEKYPDLLASVKDAKDLRYRLEGYLFPATYNYYKETEIEDLVTQMVDKMNSVMASKEAEIKASSLTNQQVLTLASLVEKEGVKEPDRRKIAQVFFNRLATDMPLQSDISILYAMDEHKVHLSNKDTQIDSPFNLYINKGYGPGPFNSPSEQAIDAVLHPEENDFLYFLADVDTGKVYFAKTYEEHLKLKEEYIDSKE